MAKIDKKAAKLAALGELKSLDEIKKEILDAKDSGQEMTSKDLNARLEHLDLSDDEINDFINDLMSEGIAFSDDVDLEIINESIEDDEDLVDYVDEEDEFDEVKNEIENLEQTFANNSTAKITDPVKMYLKEIGRV
ncbi:MAG: RNA polymerase sigma factor RpoD, partial [Erysipelotrichaceae bacterium]